MAKSKKTARRKTSKLWTAQEIKALRQMAKEKMLARVAAKKLKRTLAAVYMKASSKGISFGK